MQKLGTQRRKQNGKPPLPVRAKAALDKRVKDIGAALQPRLREGKTALWRAAAKSGIEPAVLRRYAMYMARLVFGFLMGMARLPQNLHPFGLAAICSFSEAKSVLFTYAGVALSCLFAGNGALSDFILYFL